MVKDIFERVSLKSKKFLALIYIIACIMAVMIVAVVVQPVGWPLAATMLAGMLSMGFIGVGYILSVAALDKYVQVAQITGKVPADATKPTEE